MADARKCCIYLPNERKLELNVQPKLLGRDLLDIVADHFKLREKEYFGIAYKSEGGHYSWLQNDKRVLDQDVLKKSTSRIDLLFAVKFFVESVKLLKYVTTTELYFLHVKSLVYKGQLEVDNDTAFRLAAYALQTTCGDYVDDDTALSQLKKAPVLPNKALRDLPTEKCEKAVLELYKGLKGCTKGKAIISYLTTIEALPAYGIHYYKVKDKSGVTWWIGLSHKGILQFEIQDKANPVKTFLWRQLENLYFREKKFSIEVTEKHQQTTKEHLYVEAKRKLTGDLKIHAWYGTPSLIKSIWIMAIDQHHFYLERKQNKTKLHTVNSITNLSNDLTANANSLINVVKDTPEMTRKQIQDIDVTVKKGSKDETPEMRAAKRQMLDALKTHKTDLEDRLYDKVQELKQLCLREADLIGKLPQEYIRYMDAGEKQPKIKKRIGAEFKVKLRNKANHNEKDFPTSVTAASSSSSGFSSEAADASDELTQLETEFELLTQIASAAKKLASDPSTRGRTRTKRLKSYKKTMEKLQNVENKINVLRKRCGQKPSERASMLIAEDDEDLLFEDGAISIKDGTESGRSSFSDGILLDDDTSLSSGGDALSTHSTPAILNRGYPSHPASEIMGRRQMSVGVDVSEPPLVHRSLTPPPSFERAPNITPDKAQNNHLETNHGQHSVSRSSLDSKDPNIPIRNWIRNKWEPIRVKPTRGWGESSLDDSIETGSTTSRSSGTNPDDPSSQQRKSNHADPSRVPTKPGLKQKPPSSDSLHSSSANSNHNNHNLRRSSSRDAAFDPIKLKRDVSDSALSELSIKSNPVRSNSMDADIKFKDERRIDNLPKIQELSPPSTDHFRKRSSSFTESPSHHVLLTNRKTGNKNQVSRAKGANKGQDLKGNYPTQLGERTSPANAGDQGQSGPGLQPAMFDTNLNIRMYLTRSSGHLSLATPSSHQTTAAGMGHPHPTPAENLYPQHTANIARNNQPSNYSTMHARYPVDNVRIIPANHANNGYPQAVHIPSYQQYLLNQHAAYQQQQHTHMEPGMTTAQRDILNNEVYQDIGMGWVPPLHEYGSRASVVESANAQYKKEDIQLMLKDHIATKRSSSSTNETQKRIREQYIAQKRNDENRQKPQQMQKSWSDYQKQLLMPKGRTNIFLHKPPPAPPPHTKPLQAPGEQQYYNTIHPTTRHEDEMKQRILLNHYTMHETHTDPLDYVHPPDAQAPLRAPRIRQYYDPRHFSVSAAPSSGRKIPHRMMSDPTLLETKTVQSNGNNSPQADLNDTRFQRADADTSNAEDEETVVIQSLTKSPEGHPVSVFTVTKSAPSTPLPQRRDAPIMFFNSSDESDLEERLNSTIKRQPSYIRSSSADDLLTSPTHLPETKKKNSIIIHTASFKSRIKPSLAPHKLSNNESERNARHRRDSKPPVQNPSKTRGRSDTRKPNDEHPQAPPRPKRANSRSRQATAELKSTAGPTSRVSVSNTRAKFEDMQDPPTIQKNDNRTKPRHSETAFQVSKTPVKTVPTIQVHSGTLPRAGKSRSKSKTVDGKSPYQLDFGAVRRVRRNSLLGLQASDFSNPTSAPTTPTSGARRSPKQRMSAPMAPAKLHSRSKSEAWKNSAPTLAPPSHPATLGRLQEGHEPRNRPVHPVYRNEPTYEQQYTGRRMKHHQLSASAEDLLWSGNSEGQAGTLV